MWSAAGFCSWTSSIYSVYTPSKCCYLSIWSFLFSFFSFFFFFTDDSQLHKSNVRSDFPVLACCLKDCIEDVAEWMGDCKLKMNDDKTERMAIGTRSKLSQVIPNLASMFISGCDTILSVC